MAKNLSKKELFKLIKEAVTKKVKMLKEDINLDDDVILDYYDDFNINSNPNSSDGSGITDSPGFSASSDKMCDGSLNANESKIYKSIKRMMEAKIKKNPIAFGLREKKLENFVI